MPATPDGVIEKFGFTKEALATENNPQLMSIVQNALSEVQRLVRMDSRLLPLVTGTLDQKEALGDYQEYRAAWILSFRAEWLKIAGQHNPIQFEDSESIRAFRDGLVEAWSMILESLLGTTISESAGGGVRHGFCDPDDVTCEDTKVRLSTVF